MATGEWFVIVGTGVQLVGISVLWRAIYMFFQRIAAPPPGGARVQISGIWLIRGETAQMRQRLDVLDNRMAVVEAQQAATAEVLNALRHPHPAEVVGGMLTALGTIVNLAGAILLAAQG